ncbi:MAG TPA: hypothetical protein VJ778_04430 [Burkholderiales bacterium]|nr:hypothetical protein [Burkholderiales bacterium]
MGSYEYKGYEITVTTTPFAGSDAFSPAMFTINRTGELGSLHWDAIYQIFSSPEDADGAAHAAARAWIDERGDQ